VIAVLVMRWMASAAMSAGPTTRPIGSASKNRPSRPKSVAACPGAGGPGCGR